MGRVRRNRPWSSQRRRGLGWRGRRGIAYSSPVRLPLKVAEMALERALQFACGAFEFAHNLPEVPGQFGKLFGPENDQCDDEDND